jgi:hypothetical protein
MNDRRVSIALSLLVLASAAHSADELSKLEERLSLFEERVSLYISGREKLIAGIEKSNPQTQQIACRASSTVTQNTAREVLKDLTFLENKRNVSKLTPDQISRLVAKKNLLTTSLGPIDCTRYAQAK